MDYPPDAEPNVPHPNEPDLWRGRYRSFVRLYHGRDDVVARWRNGQHLATEGERLTLDRCRDHIQMKDTYASPTCPPMTLRAIQPSRTSPCWTGSRRWTSPGCAKPCDAVSRVVDAGQAPGNGALALGDET